jgi:hypothetical protein
VQDSHYESNPTHPLGAHESWPRTGPVYDVPISDEIEIPAPAFWRRLSTPSDVSGDPSAILPGSLPVWY